MSQQIELDPRPQDSTGKVSDQRSELAATRAEIERYDRLLGLLRYELRAARNADAAGVEQGIGRKAGFLSAATRGRGLVGHKLRLRDAEHRLAHGRSSRSGQVLRVLAAAVGGARREAGSALRSSVG